MSDFELTIYQEDDSTPYFSVGTAASHPRPYLHTPETFAESEIDLKEGTARIGRINVRVIDPQTGSHQRQRALTALLGDSAGYSKLNGRRALLKQVPSGTVVMDGICAGVTLSESFAGFELALDDIRARGIDVPVFTRADTATVLPRGVLDGYGQVPGGEWLIPPSVPLRGVFRNYSGIQIWPQGFFDLTGLWIQGGEFDLINSVVPEELVVTEAMMEATRAGADDRGWFGYKDAAVLWRYPGESAWRRLNRISVGSSAALILHYPVSLPTGEPVRGAARIHASDFDPGNLPTAGRQCEVLVLYNGPPSNAYPLHIETTAGQLLRDVLAGEYSSSPPRIRFDESRFIGPAAPQALRTPVRLRITETHDDLREWFESACKTLGIAPALDPDGRIAPVGQQLPDESIVLAEINDTNAQPIPGWEHPASGAVTQVELTYPRDYRVPAGEDLSGGRSAGDGIASVSVPATVRPKDDAIQQVMGAKVVKLEGFLFRALGGEDGQPASGDVADEAGRLFAELRAYELIDRFAFGGQTSFVKVRRSDPAMAALQVGDWVLDACSWRPNYQTGQRGRNHLAQVVSIRDLNSAFRELRLIDVAPYANPVGQPTLGAITAEADGAIAVTVASIPAGAEARVDYAISDTIPDTGSGAWTFLGRTSTPGRLLSPALASGVTVWIRARGEKEGRRPSAWTNPVTISTPIIPRVLYGVVWVNGSGAPLVTWRTNRHTQGVRVYYAIHAEDESPGTFPQFVDVAAAQGRATLPVRVRSDQVVTIEIEPWTGFTGGAVSGTAGVRYRASSRGTLPPGAMDLVFRGSDGGIRTYRVHAPSGVEVHVHWALFRGEVPEDYLEQLMLPEHRRAIITEFPGDFTAPEPQVGWILRGVIFPMRLSADGLELTLAGDGVEFSVDGSEPPIILDDPIFTESPDGRSSVFSVGIDDPRGVVSGVDLFFTEVGIDSGPFPALRAGNVFSYGFSLHPDHVIIVRARINRNDGGDPIWIGPFTADTDKVPEIPDVQEIRIGDDVVLFVDAADTDAATLWYREVIDGAPQPEIQIQPRGTDDRFGSFTVSAPDTGERTFRVYAKSVAGVAGEYRDVRITPSVAGRLTEVQGRIVSHTDTTITVEAHATPEGAKVELLPTGTAVRVSGPEVGTKAPSGTAWVFQRPIGGPTQAWFGSSLAGHVDDVDGTIIAEVGQGVIPLIIRARVWAMNATTATVRAYVADAIPGGNISISYTQQNIGTVTPASPQSLAAASVTANIDTTGYVQFTIPRPSVGTGQGSVLFTASRAGRVSDVDTVYVQAQEPAVMRVDTSEDSSFGYLTLTPVVGGVFDTVEFNSQSGNGPLTGWQAKSSPYTRSVPLHAKHTSAIGYRVSRGGQVIQEGWVRGYDIGTIADVIDVSVTPDGSGTANLRAVFDTDTKTGFNTANYRVDGTGGDWLTVSVDRIATWSILQSTTAEQIVEVRGQNAAGDFGPYFSVVIPKYVPSGGGGAVHPIVTNAVASIVNRGKCSTGTQAQFRVSFSIAEFRPGYTLYLQLFRNGAWEGQSSEINLLSGTTFHDFYYAGIELPIGFVDPDWFSLLVSIRPAGGVVASSTWTQMIPSEVIDC